MGLRRALQLLACTGTAAYAFLLPGGKVQRRSTVRMMADAPIGVGVVGCGRIGQIHANTIAFRTPGAKLIAVTDPFEEMGKKVLEQTGGIPAFYKDFNEFIARDDIQAIIVGSPTPYHVEQIMAAAKMGKHVYCEKPISNDLKAIDECVKAMDGAGKKLMLGFQRRFDANFGNIKQQIEAGAIGSVRTFRIVSRDPAPPPAEYLKTSGGIFLDMVSHDFDMARFLVGDDIEEVYTLGTAWDPEAKAANDFDTQVTMLKFKNGVFGSIENSRRCSFGYDQRVEVFGEKGAINGNNRTPNTVVKSDASGIAAGLPYGFFMDRYADAYVGAVRAFVDACKAGDKKSYLASAADGKATIIAGMAAKLSADKKRPVKTSEIA